MPLQAGMAPLQSYQYRSCVKKRVYPDVSAVAMSKRCRLWVEVEEENLVGSQALGTQQHDKVTLVCLSVVSTCRSYLGKARLLCRLLSCYARRRPRAAAWSTCYSLAVMTRTLCARATAAIEQLEYCGDSARSMFCRGSAEVAFSVSKALGPNESSLRSHQSTLSAPLLENRMDRIVWQVEIEDAWRSAPPCVQA